MPASSLLPLPFAVLLAAFQVIIDVDGGDPEAKVTIAASCNAALGQARCLGEADDVEAADAADATLHVVLTFLDRKQESTRVRFWRETPEGTRESVREVRFAASDPPEQRYRALGLIVASRVLQEEGRAPVVATAAPAAARPRERQQPSRADPGLRLGLDLAATLGPGLDRGPMRAGLLTRATLFPWAFPAGPTLALRAAHRFAEPDITWTSLSFGIAVQPTGGDNAFEIETRAELLLQRFATVAQDADTGERASANHDRYGSAYSIGAVLRLSDSLQLFGAAEAHLLWPSVELEVAGKQEGTDRKLHLGGLAGLRINL